MSTQYAGNPAAAWPDDYSIPDDGDPRTAASVNTAFEALGDRTAILAADVYDRWYRMPMAEMYDTNNRWATSTSGLWAQSNVTDGGPIYLMRAVHLPPGGCITNLRYRAIGAGAHAGLPANMPAVGLEAYDDGGAAGETLEKTDDSASTAAYQAAHNCTAAAIPAGDAPVDGYEYAVYLSGEHGANALVGYEIRWVEVYVERMP